MSFYTKVLLALKTIRNFPVFVLDYLGLRRREVVYSIRKPKVKMAARGGTPDCKEIVVVMSGHEYPLDRLPPLKHPVIFDGGAHIGSFVLFAFNFFRASEPRIFAFEPERENFGMLQKNIRLNAIPEANITAYPCALGDHNGNGKLDKSRANDAYSLTEAPQGPYEVCAVKTLPMAAKEAGISIIDILKLDIEGGEYALLKHEETFEFIKNHVIFILMEHHFIDATNNADWILRRMQDFFAIIFRRGDIIFFKNKEEISYNHTRE